MEIIIKRYDDGDLESLNYLLKSVYDCERKGTLNSNNIELVAMIGDKVVGYLIFDKLYDVIRDYFYGYINYVCVLEKYRHNKIATKLFDKVFEICNKENIKYIELTSNDSRIAAHHLYNKLGFYIRNTNVFRKEFI